MIKILAAFHLVLMSCIGSMHAVALLCVQLKVAGELAIAAVLIAGVLNFFVALVLLLDDGSEYTIDTFISILKFCAIAIILKGPRGKRIRSDIRFFLSNKQPIQVVCPYDLSCDTLLSLATKKIWDEELLKRFDEILVLTDINL